MNINSLFKPKTVAVIGASDKPGFSGSTCKNLLDSNLGEKLYFVNPNRSEVMGKKCYPSISDIPEDVEMIVVCTPQHTVNSILEEAAAKGTKAAVVYASGYNETGAEGFQAEKDLIETAKKHNIAVCGPNCAGFVNTVDRVLSFGLSLDQLNKDGGNVGLIAQSGQVCLQLMNAPNIGYSYVVSSGNNSVLGIVDYLDFLVDDEDTDVISLYLEGVKDPKKFTEVLAKAAKKRKPIIVLKVGASDKGSQIAAAHTGSFAGSDEAFNAIFEKFGVIRVSDMEQLLATTTLFSKLPEYPKNSGYSISNLSGGETAVYADLASFNGIDVPELSEETKSKLKEILPSYATPNNPLDMTATVAYDPEAYRNTLRALMADPNIGMVVLGLNLPEKVTPENQFVHNSLCNGIMDVMKEGFGKPIVGVPSLSGSHDKELVAKYDSVSVPILPSPQYGFTAFKQLNKFLEYNPDNMTLEVAFSKEDKKDSSDKLITMSEHESKKLLKKYGVPVTQEYLAKSEDEAIEAANEIGYPLVLKIDSRDIPHKTDIGGVKLDIKNEAELLDAYRSILENVKLHKPDAEVNGVNIQEMLPKGMEVIVGVSVDKQFGPMVLVGLGGVFVEVFKDVKLYSAPLKKQEALEMIETLKASILFKGYRGGEELDVEALAELIVSVGDLAVDQIDEIRELDLNPVIVYPKGQGVKAADALVVK